MNMRDEAAIITNFWRQREIRARIVGGFATPGFGVYNIEMGGSERFERLTKGIDDLQRILYAARRQAGSINANDPQQRVVVRASAQPLVIEVNRPQPATLDLAAVQWSPAPHTALAGVAYLTRQGQPVTWDLTDPSTPHALVAGMSGSGKSNLLLSLIFSVCQHTPPDQLTLYVVDGGNSSLLITEHLRHCHRLAGNADDALDVVRHVAGIVQARKQRSQVNPQHRILLVVDELATLQAVMSPPAAKTLQGYLASIAAEGRKFGVHLLAATQKPLAEVTGSLTKSNMAVRFVGAMLSWSDAQAAMDMPASGAERLAGRGDFLARTGMLVRRFQVPYVPAQMAAMRAANRPWRGADINVDAVHTALCTGAPVQPPPGTQEIEPVQAEPSTGAPVQLPLPRRPPTPQDAVVLRRLYDEHRSKNKTLFAAYGTKSPLLLSWLDQALTAQ